MWCRPPPARRRSSPWAPGRQGRRARHWLQFTTRQGETQRHKLKTTALLALAAAAVAIAPASAGAAASPFGSHLTPDTQPSNAGQAHECDQQAPGTECTWILNEAYGNAGGEGAPKSGTLKKIKLIAGEAGSFQLQLAKVRADGSAKVKKNGPVIEYVGQEYLEDEDPETYRIETFKVDMPIKAGQYLAIKTDKTSTLRCSSGGDNTLLFDPPLSPGNPFTAPSNDDGCWMLIEGFVK